MKLNENLFQLGLDAHIKAAEIADSDPVGGYEGKIWQNIYRTKFAELIVKECANIANTGIDPTEDCLIGNVILKHFGIDE